jgi:hypothetical protein
MPIQPEQDNDVHVQFTVKELLARIDGKIDMITGLVHEKADKQDLKLLESRVDKMEKVAADKMEVEKVETRLLKVEQDTATKDAVDLNSQNLEKYSTKLRWVIIGIIISMLGTVAAIIEAIAIVKGK